MPLTLLVELLCMFAAFAAVGLTFFRKGKHTFGWYMTLLPFGLMCSLLLVFSAGALQPIVRTDSELYRWSGMAAAALCSGAILVFGCAIGSHRSRIPMWHQKHDCPEQIVSWGIYRYVRHPFYASYVLLMCACALAAPHYVVYATALYCLIMLNLTAAIEERELVALFGDDYAALMQQTGRFFPRLGRRAPLTEG